MKIKFIFLMIVLISGFFLVSKAQPIQEKSKPIDNESLARTLVNQCAAIKEGEFVLISGGIKNLELLEDIAVNVRKLGAFPLLTIGSDRLNRLMYTEVPEKYDSQKPELDLKLFSFVTTVIGVDYGEKMDLLADIKPERFVARSKASEPANDLFFNRKVKFVGLGNGLYPTEERAKQLDLTLNELTDIFWEGINVDYKKLEATGKTVKGILSAGKEVRITNPNGTDIKMKIENRKVFVSDGTITKEDMNQGKGDVLIYLPAGEVVLAPVPGTAEGKIVVDRDFVQNNEITGLNLDFRAGKLTSMSAKSGIERFKALYDAGGKGKDEFGTIDFGINPNVKLKPSSKMGVWMPAGMVTFSIGNNLSAGGENNSSFGYGFFVPGSTVTVDGKVLVENGVLKY
jgi:leucyl aminopeptidase (aminopeptidase T)